LISNRVISPALTASKCSQIASTKFPFTNAMRGSNIGHASSTKFTKLFRHRSRTVDTLADASIDEIPSSLFINSATTASWLGRFDLGINQNRMSR
jgi:hypothetical protein